MEIVSYNRNDCTSLFYTQMSISKRIDYIISNHPLLQMIYIKQQTKEIETTHLKTIILIQRNIRYTIFIVDLNRLLISQDDEAIFIRHENQ